MREKRRQPTVTFSVLRLSFVTSSNWKRQVNKFKNCSRTTQVIWTLSLSEDGSTKEQIKKSSSKKLWTCLKLFLTRMKATQDILMLCLGAQNFLRNSNSMRTVWSCFPKSQSCIQISTQLLLRKERYIYKMVSGTTQSSVSPRLSWTILTTLRLSVFSVSSSSQERMILRHLRTSSWSFNKLSVFQSQRMLNFTTTMQESSQDSAVEIQTSSNLPKPSLSKHSCCNQRTQLIYVK